MTGTGRVVLGVACLYLVENVLGGPRGVFFNVPVRYALFALTALLLGIVVLRRGRTASAHALPIWAIATFLAVQAVWAVIVPVLQGTRFEFALAESRAIAVVLLPVLGLAACPEDLRARVLYRLQRTVVLACTALAVAQLVIWVIGTVFDQYHAILPLALAALFPESSESMYVGAMPDGFFRVFWISSLWYAVALFWTHTIESRGARNVIVALLLGGVFVSYSRGIWLGVAAGYALVYAAQLRGHDIGRTTSRAVLGLATLAVLLGVLVVATGQVERVRSRVASSVSVEDQSIDERVQQVPHLLSLWERNPVLGGGYGAYAPDHIRSEAAPYAYEHMPLAILAKLGLLGVALTLGFCLLLAGTTWSLRQRLGRDAVSLLGGGGAFAVAAGTNPMLINLVGMTIVALLLFQWGHLVAQVTADFRFPLRRLPLRSDGELVVHS